MKHFTTTMTATSDHYHMFRSHDSAQSTRRGQCTMPDLLQPPPIQICNFPPIKYIANDDFSEPPRRAGSKSSIFMFCQFLGLGHL